MKLIQARYISSELAPRVCEWRERKLRCTDNATRHVITDEDERDLCEEHYQEYLDLYIYEEVLG